MTERWQDESAAARAWEKRRRETPEIEPWSALPQERRDSLTTFVGDILDGTNRRENDALARALYRHYDKTPNKSTLHRRFTMNGQEAMCHMEINQDDGSTLNQLLRATFDDGLFAGRQPAAGRPVKITVVTEWVTWHAEYWERQIADRSNAIVADGIHYRIGSENAGKNEFRGFGGRKWRVDFLDGRESVITTNLWYQGKIPPQMRDRLPDDATLTSLYKPLRITKELP